MTPIAANPPQPLPLLDPANIPNLDNVVTEDGVPVESVFAEKQYRLLTDPLYNSWPGPGEGRPFLVMTNVGLFHTYKQPPLVPDCLLSLDVRAGEDLREKENHSYFLWVFGKPPDVVIEIVSDKRGDEEDFKKSAYAHMRVSFYVIFDPDDLLRGGVLRAYALHRGKYKAIAPRWLPAVGLGLTLWQGAYEGATDTWLRWCDREGRVIPSGGERAVEATQKVDAAIQRVDEAIQKVNEATRKADEANQKAERLAAQLRALGVKPEV
ncbi:MAG TPA: Uma2 family endonuclease [Gemmataceae bacterium]|nr:Uma2 family endonuclease [Gemmataceae bacterium]